MRHIPESMGTQEGGPGYPRHRDNPGLRHGGTDGLIRAEHSNPHTNFER